MLVLRRKEGQQILIGNDIKITIIKWSGSGVVVGIEAPTNVVVERPERLLAARRDDLDDLVDKV